MNPELIGLFVYVSIQFAIGIWVARRIRDRADYLLAGRSVGLFFATLSIFATWFGAETCLGSAGAIYDEGLAGGRADPFGYTVCLIGMGLFLAARFWRAGIVTLGDLFRERYSTVTERVTVLVMIPTSILWAAGQLRAFGVVLAHVAGVEVLVGLLVATVIVTVYTSLGGLKADIITDCVQGIALMIGLVLLLFVGIDAAGGWGEAWRSIPAERLSWVGPGESWWVRLDTWAIPIIGSLVGQELVARMLACRSADVARRATLVGAGVYITVGSIPVILALVGPSLVADLDEPEQYLPALAAAHLPLILQIMFTGALVSAILSTIDSTLLAVSSFVSQNLVPRAFNARLSDRGQLLISRGGVILSGVIALLLAVQSESIYDLVVAASSFGTAGIVVITLFGIYSGLGGPKTAIATVIAGVVLPPTYEDGLALEAPYIASLASCAMIFLIGALLGRRVTADSARSE